MAQQPRISSRFTCRVEEALDYLTNAYGDHKIDDEEAATLESMLTRSYQLAMDVDAGIQIGIAIIRGGPDSDHARRLRNELLSDSAA